MKCFLSGRDTTYDIKSMKYNHLYLNNTDVDDFYLNDIVKIDKNDNAVHATSMDDKPVYSFVSYVVQNLKDEPEPELNEETDEAIKEGRAGKGVVKCKDADDMFSKLGISDIKDKT